MENGWMSGIYDRYDDFSGFVMTKCRESHVCRWRRVDEIESWMDVKDAVCPCTVTGFHCRVDLVLQALVARAIPEMPSHHAQPRASAGGC